MNTFPHGAMYEKDGELFFLMDFDKSESSKAYLIKVADHVPEKYPEFVDIMRDKSLLNTEKIQKLSMFLNVVRRA